MAAIKVRNKQYLSVSNLGDSGVAIFRPVAGDRLEFVYETEPAQHMFNNPFQCGVNHDGEGHAPLEGVEYKDGDVLILYSDGFSDNVYRGGYYQCLEEELVDGIIQSLSKAADCLARKAFFLSKTL